ncbi:hypothetical protein CONLIGDRAFT_699375 [Coniochaeta ligniaria NRRL 30616]|uniref:Uncharacterized protein n=1 Tax=Coniochaeta ligniaria NRRL 30616 TaxID=1408157 RepID=A0A1J7IXV0_9PEZI|nr:hypothetical protein CONLIGDRAFT_699375 [Coniochaeta ligniaria NRRL 30616]
MGALSVKNKSEEHALSDLVASAADQVAWIKENLSFLQNDPAVLVAAVQAWWDSRPGVVRDATGYKWPIYTDKFISSAFCGAIHESLKEWAIWECIFRLVQLFEANNDRHLRSLISHELSDVCMMEFRRAQAYLKRHIQTGAGAECFTRVSSVQDSAGNATVKMNVRPESLTIVSPHLHYLLSLCHQDTAPSDAIDWLTRLGSLYEAIPSHREGLKASEYGALSSLAFITGFIKDFSPAIGLQPPNPNRRGFRSRVEKLDVQLAGMGRKLDMRAILWPIEDLLKPQKASFALGTFKNFVQACMGKGIRESYDNLVNQCLSNVQTKYLELKRGPSTDLTYDSRWNSAQDSISQAPKAALAEPKQKQRTRAAPTDSPEAGPAANQQEAVTTPPRVQSEVFRVSRSTLEVFSSLFDHSEASGPVNWSDFTSAMVELGFAIEARYGSAYKFSPPRTMSVIRPLSVHHPHVAKMEGRVKKYLAHRLKDAYGWDKGTFQLR